MAKTFLSGRLAGTVGAALFLAAFALPATAQDRVNAERQGIDPDPGTATNLVETGTPVSGSLATGLLLIPESTNDRVMAFDPLTGDLVNADFIPSDPTNLSTPIQAILAADGNSILVSDQIDDVVQQYAVDGTYMGVFAPAGGVDTSILDNIRGMALRPNGNLVVTVGGGANDDAVAEFDTGGNYLGNFVANAAGGLNSPFDVLPRGGDYLVAGITSDKIHSYDLTGTAGPDFAPVDTFPEQLAMTTTGNVLVGNFSGAQEGVMEFTAGGSLVGVYDPASLGGYRGVYELPNGNILTSNGGGVHEIDRSGNLVETKISGVSARFISYAKRATVAAYTPVPALRPGMLVLLCILLGLMAPLVHRAFNRRSKT